MEGPGGYLLVVGFMIWCSMFKPVFCQLESLTYEEFNTAETKTVKSFPPPQGGQLYSLFQGQRQEVLNRFEISTSGVLSVKGPLEYKRGESNVYDIIIVQRPLGETSGGTAQTLRVTVKDKNNFDPTFPRSLYYGFVQEGSRQDVVVQGLGDCYAEDRDSYGIDKYSIVLGNEKGYFKVETRNLDGSSNSRKFLVLKTTTVPIVRDPSNPNIILTVRAVDRDESGNSARAAQTKILVTVEDQNNNKPVFTKPQYDIKDISEDTPTATSIGEVRATDKDDGRNGGVYYYLNPLSDYFSVDTITGAIRVVRELDYRIVSSTELTVFAVDRGRSAQRASTKVKITIRQDIANYPPPNPTITPPNSPPTFPDGPYNFKVREDFPVGAAILIIRSIDKEREKLSYSLSGGSGVFKLNSQSGVLTLENRLDYESGTKLYTMQVRVQDSSNAPVTTQLYIEVQDVDENYNNPVFDQNTIQKVASVDEGKPAGSLVTTVTAKDSDSGSDGEVVYSITGGTGLGLFTINGENGEVRTVMPLNRAFKSSYKLTINATDKAIFPRTSSMFLMIDVKAVDKNRPEFARAMYVASVPEKLPSNTFVTAVYATDKDGQAVSYGVSDPNFKMESTTGIVRTTRAFDPQVNPRFELEVTASAGSLSSRAQVNVTVASKEGSPPKFTKDQYNVDLPENQPSVPNLACIAAVDSNNKPVTYSIISGADNRIQLDKNNGRLSTSQPFNYEVENAFKLEVRAIKEGGKVSSDNNPVVVNVNIKEEIDVPKFEKSKYDETISEDLGLSATVSFSQGQGFRIIDDDTNPDQFECEMVNIQTLAVLDTFKIVQSGDSCRLVTLRKLEYSEANEFRFQVRATDKNFRYMFAIADVIIRVEDKNNNAPQFSQTSYWTSVSTNTADGAEILTVMATDKDVGRNKDIIYSLESGSDSSRFRMVALSGKLEAAASLKEKMYTLTVSAKDSGNPQKKTSVQVYVSVYDAASTTVRFDPDSYSKSLSEDARLGTSVFNIKATAPGSLAYSIVGGNSDGRFKIDSKSGLVTTEKSLNYEQWKSHRLVVRAKTSSPVEMANEVVCTVAITDVNDNKPRFAFNLEPEPVAIESYTPGGSKLIKALAIDEDSEKFGPVTYSIDTGRSSSNLPFKVDPKSGQVTATKVIKFSEGSSYTIALVATDKEGKSATSTVKVTVVDVSEPPKFQKEKYDANVREVDKPGDTVQSVKAKYSDPNNNNPFLKYTFTSGNEDGAFCINRDGLITIARPLDREKVSRYTLNVKVEKGTWSHTTEVVVNVQDMNDGAPLFSKALYEVDVKEDENPPKEILRITASDKDSGENGKVSYSLLQTADKDSESLFDVGATTGAVIVKAKLDYEQQRTHTLFIKAQDGGKPSLSSITKVLVKVENVNDNFPVFSVAKYRAKIALDTPVKSKIIQLFATDQDSLGANEQNFKFRITEGNTEDAFEINEVNGLITLKKSLATVSDTRFELKVSVSDGQKTSKVPATVELNVYLPDGPPKFSEPRVVVNVKEGVEVNKKVTMIRAATSEALTYSILSGDDNSMFKVESSTGAILATRTLDAEERTKYELLIRAQDTRDRSAEVIVVINVENINDNVPSFVDEVDDQLERRVIGEMNEGDIVTSLEAIDKDRDVVTYEINSEAKKYFEIDAKGLLRAKGTLKDLGSSYSLTVTATDNGSPPQKNTANVRLVFVQYRPNQQPVRAKVAENLKPGLKLARVPRVFPGGKLKIVYPSTTNFTIDNDGWVRSRRALDYEEKRFYSLTSQEVDSQGRKNFVDIEITVLDVNDNGPEFKLSELYGLVNKNARSGAPVYRLSAYDKDSGSSGIVGYQLLSIKYPFTINPFTSTIETSGRLDPEKYRVRTQAFDFGIPRRRSNIASIDIDTSRIPPRFKKNNYVFKVDEQTPTGKLIGSVSATSDSGLRIGYTIVEGDSGNKFRIDSEGRIFMNYILNYEVDQREYDLKVRATELIPPPDDLKSDVDVRIELQNINDHFPRFTKAVYSKSVREDIAPGLSVLTVTATDCDCSKSCSCALGQLRYTIVSDYFAIDSDSGTIRTKKELDYESVRSHNFRVFVTDFGKKRNLEISLVEITVQNTNDNAPQFLRRDYEIDIAEDATKNTPLASIQARDLDGDDVTYSIVSGGGPFTMEKSTGILKLTESIPNGKTQYTLLIRAQDQDGKRESDARVVIKIEDKNNNRPRFTNCDPVSVEENQPKGKKVVTIKATDLDRGKNGEIEYGLQNFGDSINFRIDNTTGEITTATSLDREKAVEKDGVLKVVVWAQDGGHGRDKAERLISYCFLKVTIKDQNDNYPVFLTRSYVGSVYNRASIGTLILSVSATDADSDENARVKYTMPRSEYFEIDGSSGEIKTRADLTSIRDLTETLTVTAANTVAMLGSGSQPTESRTNVEITISSLKPPVFTQRTYSGSIAENVLAGTPVVSVSAIAQQNDPKTGKPYSVIYNLVKANPEYVQSFKISLAGEISTAGQLDFERTKEYRLQVRAEVNSQNNRLSSTAFVKITITDVNDDSPTFLVENNYEARVLENAKSGSEVITVEAEDRDTGGRGRVKYIITQSNDRDKFNIDPDTGKITTKGNGFDRESLKVYTLTIEARDEPPSPEPVQTETTYVLVTVVDENDNKPFFNQSEYVRSVNEDRPLGFSVMEVVAKDSDIGENARLDYFVTGVQEAVFEMNTVVNPRNYGLLTVGQPLDYESTKEYRFKVTATDRKDSASANIIIKINDVNDNAPKFTKSAYSVEIQEESGPGKSVMKVTATDVDTKQVQEEITYSLDKRGLRYFTIDSKTGQIYTSSTKMDREKYPIYFFTVQAYDGKNTGSADVKVKLTDINDNAPVFPNQPYIGYIEENRPVGTSVMIIQAIDTDDPEAGKNAVLEYSLDDNAGGGFKIDPKTGLITSLKVFDREVQPNTFSVKVKATDGGNPKLSGTTNVKIVVLDANDHFPVITTTEYRATVPENARPGYLVTRVSATDKDEGPNAEFEFVIVDGNDPQGFYIEPRNGTVHVSGILDFETRKSFLLNVTVRDRGIPEKIAKERAYIYITITDSNDNAPEFSPQEYNVTISEDASKESVVQVVTANDPDSGTNAALTFSITGGNDADLFSIRKDPNNGKRGIVYVAEMLDRETKPVHELQVTATDGGGLTGNAIVRVTLKDVNDNGPHFVPAFYEAKILENVDSKQTVTMLSAYDPDDKSNGAPFTFKFFNGTKGDNFRIEVPTNVTSMVYSYGQFDRETTPVWKLGVQAVDSGKPKPMTNFTYLYVEVGDVNEFEPYDGEMTILVNVYNKDNPDSFVGGVIGKPYYKDEDYDGDVNDYAMEDNKYFSVNPTSGDITMAKNTPLGSYNFKVRVTESRRGKNRGGNFPKTVESSIGVIVRSVTKNDLKHSFVLRFLDILKAGYFIGDYYNKFLVAIADIFSVGTGDVIIFSVQRPREPTMLPAVNVVLAVRKGGGYYSVVEALAILTKEKVVLERLGLQVGAIGVDYCAQETQKVGVCHNVVEGYNNFTVASGDYGQVPAPQSSFTFVSVYVKLYAKYVTIVEPRGNCTPNPCLNGGTCHINLAVGDTARGYVCECPLGYGGPECQATTRTFLGSSYIWLAKLQAYENSKIELEMITEKEDGLLLYQGPLLEGGNNGLKDFLAVLLVEGRIQIHISLGHTPVVIKMTKGNKLNDKEWHVIQVFRQLKTVTVIIDKCERAEVVEKDGKLVENTEACMVTGSVKGESVYLDGFGPLQIGGTEEDELKYPDIPYTKFVGCIRKIIDNGRMYDLANPLKEVNIRSGCTLANPCPNCNNKGYCEPLWNQPSICVCNLGYSGSNCDGRAKATYYLPNSFTQYMIKSSKKRRQLVPPPVALNNEYYTNIALQVKLQNKSASEDVVLFLSTNSLGTEFNKIDVKNGVLRYTFRLGDRMKTLKIPQINVTDGKYHSVVVKREGNSASLQIDFDGKVEGNTGGSHRLLNMGGGSFFSGGLPNITVVRVVQAIVQSGGNAIVRNSKGEVIASGTGVGLSRSGYNLITVGSGGSVLVDPSVVESAGQFYVRAVHLEDGRVLHGNNNHDKSKYTTTTSYTSGSGGGFSSSSSTKFIIIGGPVRDRSLSGKSADVSGSSSDAGASSAAGSGSGASTGGASSSVSTGGTQIGTSLTGVAQNGEKKGGAYGSPIEFLLPPSAATGTGSGSSTGSGTSTGAEAGSNDVIRVLGDFGGCTASQSFNGVDLESDPSIEARRQNVVNGCPCETGFCQHGGTCVDAVPAYCLCPPGWTGVQCTIPDTVPKAGQRPGTRFANPGVIACIVVILLAIIFIIGAILLKRKTVPTVAEVLVDDGDTHDNIRVYHDEGAGEEDNFGYDKNQLMKYTYVENGGLRGEAFVKSGAGKRGGLGSGEEEITRAEERPLLTSGSDNNGLQHGVTTITRRRVIHPDSIDVGRFIDTRIIEANREYTLAHDSIHIYKYEGDDTDVDDLSELGESDEEEEDEDQDFQFLHGWGSKFDGLNRIFNEE